MMHFQDFLRRLAVPLIILLCAAATPAAEGQDYTRLARPQPVEAPGKIEVIEFFWYGCPHCSKLEPMVEAWEKRLPKDVVVRREHVIWGGRKEIEVHARLFLTLRAMNLLEQHHRAVFEAIHGSKVGLRDAAQVLDWVAKRGIDKAKFDATFKSFGVGTQTARAKQRTEDYGIDSVPSFVVNGKYKTSLSAAGGEERLFALLNRLIAEERGKK
jgi:thiol:disulfide interchange protein DsbA